MRARSLRSLPIAVLVAMFASGAAAQQPAAPPPTKTLSQNLGVMVFPAKGQPADQQAKDESDCYGWSKQQTGFDPAAPPPPPAAPPPRRRGEP